MIPVFSANFGGPVSVVRFISKELAKRHEVTVYTTAATSHRHDFIKSPIEVQKCGYRTVYFPRNLKFFGFNISKTMAEALKENIQKYDIVHLHSWRHFQDIIVHHYARRFNVPYVLQVHGSLPKNNAKKNIKLIYDATFGKKIIENATGLFALNYLEALQYEHLDALKEKIRIIPNGIDLSLYNNLPLEGTLKKKYDIADDEKIVLYLGRIHKIKGIDILVRAFSEVVRIVKNTRLILVGPDDGYLYELKSLIKTLKIENNVLITGPLYGRNKLEAYVDAEVYVLPSRYEIWGMTVLEAYACSKPVIATKVGGLKNLVVNGVTGILIDPEDASQLTNSLVSLLNDSNKSTKMGLKGNEFVKENFAIEKVTNKIENLYNEIIASRTL